MSGGMYSVFLFGCCKEWQKAEQGFEGRGCGFALGRESKGDEPRLPRRAGYGLVEDNLTVRFT